MGHIWIQYTDASETADIAQTMDSYEAAKEADKISQTGCVWFRFEVSEGTGKLINKTGPVTFDDLPQN
jgi:hypothetical protein